MEDGLIRDGTTISTSNSLPFAAIASDTLFRIATTVGIVPIVNDALENVGVTAAGQGCKEIAPNDFAPIGQSGSPHVFLRLFGNIWQVKENSPQHWVRPQNCTQ